MFDYYSSEINFMIKEILENTNPGIYNRRNWSRGQKAKSRGQKAEKPADFMVQQLLKFQQFHGGRENN